ncbi:hypothetical protein C8R45DRAFT_947412 [Mycena sanguinolenta]|nr:hypothetical protein C8R45DRAFT_947412 [Mycena sanguinolenta]
MPASSRKRTNAILCLSKAFPAVFDHIERSDPQDASKLIKVDPPFAHVFKKCLRWWELAEPPENMMSQQLQQLNQFLSTLVETMDTKKKTAKTTAWPSGIESYLKPWGQAAHVWDKEVERVLKQQDLSFKAMWFRAAPSERGGVGGMPPARVWDPHHAKICTELFPDLTGLETATGNIVDELRSWLVAWLSDHIHTSRKAKERMEKSVHTTEGGIGRILGPNFWQTHVLDISGLKMPVVTALNRLLLKWADQLEWSITLAEENNRLQLQLGPDASPEQIRARWETLSDSAKRVEWAGYAYGQTESIVNRVRRHKSAHKEIELDLLVSDTLKTAILHGRKLGQEMTIASGAKIQMATEEEIAEFYDSLAENLQMWGQGDAHTPWEALRTTWYAENDGDSDTNDTWEENPSLTGTDLGINRASSGMAGACTVLKEGWTDSPGILLADDVGTGKTLQILTLLATLTA